MSRIAGFRAEISADRGGASRLSHNRIEVRANNKDHAVTVAGYKDGTWVLNLCAVTSIGSGGASINSFETVTLTAEDMEAVRERRCVLALLTEAEIEAVAALRGE